MERVLSEALVPLTVEPLLLCGVGRCVPAAMLLYRQDSDAPAEEEPEQEEPAGEESEQEGDS